MKQLFTTILLLCTTTVAFSQANTKLSNLVSPTAVNQSLLPNSNNIRNLGSSSYTWKTFYLTGSIYKGSQRFLSNTGYGNTFVGLQAGKSTTEHYNTGIGDSALFTNSTGSFNTATGALALYTNSTGSNNTANGEEALFANTTGAYNTAIGELTLPYNTTGFFNTAIGTEALYLNRNEGAYNTAVGARALFTTTTSQYNTAIGFFAGNDYNNGYNNVFVGANTDVNGAGYYNVIAIGQATICTAPSQVTIGNGATNSYRAYANWSNISDGRFKKNIQANVPGLSFVTKLRPITYTLDASGLDAFLNKGRIKETQPSAEAKAVMDKALKEKETIVQTGFVAQEVEKAAKELNYDFSAVDKPKNANDVYGLRYSDFVVPLVKAVQELDSANKAKDERIANQQQQIDELRKMLLELKGSTSTVTSSAAYLEQNTPNPVSGTTRIGYHIPETVTSARLDLTNAKGQLVKTMNISKGTGQVNLNTAILASGTYNYTLYVDGKLVDSKRLVIAR